MKLKNKILIGASLLVAIPIIISSLIIGYQSSSSAYRAMEQSTQERLLAVRDITKGRIEDYLANIDKQVRTFSQDRMIIDALTAFKAGYDNYPDQVEISAVKAKKSLASYYQQEFNQKYQQQNQGNSSASAQWLSNLSDNGALLQNRLIKVNPNPQGEKQKLTALGDGSDYDKAHQLYHPVISAFLDEFQYYDIFLVDTDSGNVVYSVFKELDFATSLSTGSFANSGIGQVYSKAKSSTGTNFSTLADFASYAPSYEDPASFIASPIFDQGRQIGVLIFQMPVGKINQIMTHDNQWSSVGLGKSGETYLIGADKTLRSQSRFLIEDKPGYINSLKQSGASQKIVDTINAKNTGIGFHQVDTSTANKALQGNTGLEMVDDYRDVSVLSAFAPIKIAGLNWAILAEIDADEAFSSANAMTAGIQLYAVIVGGILIIIGAFAGLLFANSISRPILTLSKGIAEIEQNSDLTYRLDVASSDEIGEASQALNSMLIKFHAGIKDVAENASQIATTAEQTSVISNQNNALITEQQDQTALVATAMEEMTCTVEEVAGNIGNAVIAVNGANEQSTEGYNIMRTTVDAVEQLAEQIVQASKVMNDFELHSGEIVAVLDVIKGVAEQTNLLALNAAIEAARAGEQGRGFAVVADEVRALAGRTQDSTAEISGVIDKLKSSSLQVVKVMEQSQQSAQEVVKQASVAGDRFSAVSDSINAITDMNTQIATAVEEQRATSVDINQNVISISDMANENSEGSKQTAEASQYLATLSVNLRSLVEQFKI
jgi:methyl-accepting chemotaxis protein